VEVWGGNAPGYQSGAEAKADILKLMDIPEEKMVLETRSRKILLSTSASHIRRAKAIFTGIGISVLPAATDYQLVERALDRSLAGDNQKDQGVYRVSGVSLHKGFGAIKRLLLVVAAILLVQQPVDSTNNFALVIFKTYGFHS